MDHAALLPVVVTAANALFTTLRIVAHVHAADRARPVPARSRPYRIEATTFGPVRNHA